MEFRAAARRLLSPEGAASRIHFSWTMADQMVVSGGNFLTSIVIARFLGIVEFGVFSLAWIVVLFIQSIATAAVTTPMMSIGPKLDDGEAASYYGSSFLQQLAIGLGFALLLATYAVLEPYVALDLSLGAMALPLIACLLLTQVQDFLRRYCLTTGRAPVVMRSDVMRYIVQLALLALVFGGVVLEANVASALWAIALASLVGIAAFAGTMPRATLSTAAHRRWAARNFGLSRWLIGAAVLQWTGVNFFILVSGVILGPAAAGALKAAQTLLGVLHVFFQAAEPILLPYAARLYRDVGDRALRSYTLSTLVAVVAGTVVAALPLAIPSEWWMSFLFGETYTGHGYLIVAFAVVYTLMGAAIPLRVSLVSSERPRGIFVVNAVTAFATVTTAWPLISTFGLVGAVAGMVGARILLVAGLLIYSIRPIGQGQSTERSSEDVTRSHG
jgi:O-antigen/teichoic acid export membrane protein